MMLKIVPFLVWYRVYAPRAGREPVPTLAQLSWPFGERLAYGLLTAGTLALALAVATGARPAITAAGRRRRRRGRWPSPPRWGGPSSTCCPGPGRRPVPAPLPAEPR